MTTKLFTLLLALILNVSISWDYRKYLGRKAIAPLSCSQLSTNAALWGGTTNGFYLTPYSYPLQYVGCFANDGCVTFSCNDSASSIQFGTTSSSSAMRSLIGDFQDYTEWPQTYSSCCSTANPTSICDAPSDNVSANALCNQIGYTSGYVIASSVNYCPNVMYDGNAWTSDYRQNDFWGRTFICEGGIPPSPCIITANNSNEYVLDLSTLANDLITAPIEGNNGTTGTSVDYIACGFKLQCIGGNTNEVGAKVYNDFGCVTALITPTSTLQTFYNVEQKRFQLQYVTQGQCQGIMVFDVFWQCNPSVSGYNVVEAKLVGICNLEMIIDSALACIDDF